MEREVEINCIICSKAFKMPEVEYIQFGRKTCSTRCGKILSKEYVVDRPCNPKEDARGKANFESERELISALKTLTKRGYYFQTKGRTFDVSLPKSNFYGIMWGFDNDTKTRIPVYFVTTKQEVYAAYSR